MLKILVSEPVITGGYNSVLADQNGLDPEQLRAWLLFHDHIAYSFNPDRPVWPGYDAEYLESIGQLTYAKYSWNDNFPSYVTVIKGHVDLYRQLDGQEPGIWAMARAPGLAWNDWYARKVVGSFARPHFEEGRGLVVRLIDCIPLPEKEVPLDEVVGFKTKNAAELAAFHAYVVEIYESVLASIDRPLAEHVAVRKLSSAIEGLVRKSRESNMSFKWGSIDANFNLVAAAGASLAASSLGAGMLQMASAFFATGALSVGPSIGFERRQSESRSPFCYVTRVHGRADWA